MKMETDGTELNLYVPDRGPAVNILGETGLDAQLLVPAIVVIVLSFVTGLVLMAVGRRSSKLLDLKASRESI